MDVYTGLLDGINAKKQPNVTLDNHLQSLKPYVRFLRRAYFGKPVVVPYEKREIQDAYLLTYFPHYYQLIYKIFLEEAPDFFKGKKSVSISFIGGGPGSEIYGLIRYIANNAKQIKHITINLFDINAETWKYSHEIVDVNLLQKTVAEDVIITWTSYTLDITSRNEVLSYQRQLAASDLVVIQNCLNEIAPALVEQTNNNIIKIFDWLSPQAYLLLSDMTSAAKEVLKAIEKQIVVQFNPVFHKTTLKSDVSGTMISSEHIPPSQIKKNLLTGEDGLIPRKYIKYDYTIFSKANEADIQEITALGFGALYGPLNFSHLDLNGNAHSKVFVGIDFGTSTTAVSVVHIRNGNLEIEPLAIPQKGKNATVKYERLISGVVSKIDGVLMVGYFAGLYKKSLTYGVNCWHSFKANLGSLETIHYPASSLKNHSTYKIEGMKDALAIFLKYLNREVLKLLAEKFPGKEPMYALSVPVGYGSKEKQQLKIMMAEAGFECKDVPFIEEPNAAMIHYFFATNTTLEIAKPLKTLIFDLGAGTVDLSIIEVQRQGTDVISKLLAVHRDGNQGGNCIDSMIADKITQENILLADIDQNGRQSLIDYCEELKVLMCKGIITDMRVGYILNEIAHSEITISLPDYFTTQSGDHILVGITYKKLNDIMHSYWNGSVNFKGIKSLLRECLRICGLNETAVDKVIITGGGGRNPYVKNYLATQFGASKLYIVDDIQEQVARGTALHSFIVNSFGRPIFTSLLNENYYIEIHGKKQKVFLKGDGYPTHDIDMFFNNHSLDVSIINVYKSEAFELTKSFLIEEPENVRQLVFYIDPDQEMLCEVITISESHPAIEVLN